MGGRKGALGMRVTGRELVRPKREGRAMSSSVVDPISAPRSRARADSAPMPALLVPHLQIGSESFLSDGGDVESTMSPMSGDLGDGVLSADANGLENTEDGVGELPVMGGLDSDEMGDSDDDEFALALEYSPPENRLSLPPEKMVFPILPIETPRSASTLTAALQQHIPHLLSSSASAPQEYTANPFRSLYASVAAPPGQPSISLELYFPHSTEPTRPIMGVARKDVTVEEVTGYGLWRYWEEGREPKLEDEEVEDKLSTVGWGLRMVEDDGEVDEDFPGESRLASVRSLTPQR